MTWPLSQDYNEAIQEPRGNFGDAELKTGEAVANPLGIPMPRSGNFADVYEVRCPGGNRWAVKCFTRQVSGLRERYNEISKYLRQAQLPFTVDFHYLEQGIRVRGQWYPVLKMQWVEGFVLNEFVRDNLDKKPILDAMSRIWLRMARRLRAANIAHGDLQHGNVMLVPGSAANALAVKLIDYDGMCVPSLVSKKSGEVGHPAYQHPERLRTGAYGSEMDRFSLLSIAASLRCLTIGGRSLWERYDDGDNLLFRQSDFQAPKESPLFRELAAIRDPQAQALVRELQGACQAALNAVPLVTDLLPEEKPTAKVTAGAAAGAQGPDWDFSGDDADGSIVKRRRKRKSGLWGWATAASAAAVLLAGTGLGIGLLMQKRSSEKQGSPVAQIPSSSNTNGKTAKTPKSDKGPQPKPVIDSTETVAPPSPARTRTVYLADLPEARVMAVSFEKRNGSKVKGIVSPNALLLHPSDKSDARVTYDIGRKYLRFKAAVGIRDGTNAGRGSGSPLTFRVLGDGKELWTSGAIQQCGVTRECDVPVTGVDRLELQVQCPGSAYCAHAVWVEPRLEEDNSSPRPVLGPPPTIVWLPPIDPDGDCALRKSGGRLTIEVPGKDHDLGAERGRMNAPRLLFDAEGDFNALVRVSGEFQPSMDSTVPGKPPVVAAGLVLQVDDRTYIRLERMVVYRNQKLEEFGNWEMRQEGKRTFTQTSPSLNGKETYLRLIRRGNQLRGSVRAEGQQWYVLPPIVTSLPQKVRIGVDAISCSSRPFAPSFDRLLFQQGRSQFARLEWPNLAAPKPPVVVAQPPRNSSGKREVPDEKALAAARQQLREKFKAAYDRKGGKRELAKQLHDVGDSAGFSAPALQYAALSESSRIAAAAGDLSLALDAANDLWKRFDVNLLDLKCAVLEQAQEAAAKSSRNREIAQQALLFFDRSLMNEDYKVADRLLKAARSAAAKSDSKTVLERAATATAEKLKLLRGEFEKVRSAARTLEDKPDDAEANRRLGLFRCIHKGDWEGGLPLLAKGDEKTLSALAEKDLEDPNEVAAQVKLGDGWYDLASKTKTDPKARAAWMRRAQQWYEDASGNGIEKLPMTDQARVQKRLLQMAQGRGWSNLDFSRAPQTRKAGALHLYPRQMIATKQWYGRGIEAAVVMGSALKTTKNHLRLTLFNGGQLEVDVMGNRVEWKVYLPFGDDPDGAGVESRKGTSPIKAGEPLLLRYRAVPGQISMWINKNQVFGISSNRRMTGSAPVRLWSDDGEADIASVTVKRVRER